MDMTTQRKHFAHTEAPTERRTPSSRGSWDARPEPSWRRSGPKARVVPVPMRRVSPLVAIGVFTVGFGVGVIIARSLGVV